VNTIDGIDMEHLDTFLARTPPFDTLAADERAAIAVQAEELRLAAGEDALVEDGRLAGGLYVVLAGAMDLVHDGEVVQTLEPGECFGHPSLLTGMAPIFTVRAREDSTCLLLAPETALRALASEGGARYVATTMRTRLTRTGHTVHGLLDVGTTPVSAIMRPPVVCSPGEPLRAAIAKLDDPQVAALLLQTGSGEDGPPALAILTDGDVRRWLARGEGSLEAPARAAARSPVPTVPVGQLAVEATIDMLAAGTDNVVVLDGDRLCGTLSAADLLGLDARSPIALRHTILGAADEDVLARAASHLPQLFLLLLRAGVPPRDLGRVLSLQHDALVTRLIDFSISRHGPAPVPWAWLDLGSAARREFTLASDQDNALAYESPPAGAEAETETDAYFARLGREVNQGLARCGFGVDNNNVLAGDASWRMSRADWLRTFEECLREPSESHLIRATVAFDFRPAAGGLAVTGALTRVMRDAREHPDFMRLMAKSATGFSVALSFAGNFAVERHGEQAGRLDLKHGAIIPLVNLVRFHALANGVTISPTLDRIEAVASVGGLERADADALKEAFEAILRVRFERHAELIARDEPPDNLIDPKALAPIARTELREALHTVRRGQKRLGTWVPSGL
jgi:CBS domain-containing protein